ncbi:MAG: c-type cytochrome [Pyrinomonadaceae bacterium]
MKTKWQQTLGVMITAVFGLAAAVLLFSASPIGKPAFAQTSPTPVTTQFDQAAALAVLRQQIKGREQEPAENVFKNIQTLKAVPAGRFLAIMNFGYSRSLGVDCTHCHVPEKWESEDKKTKQIAREMKLMADQINQRLLKNIENLKSVSPTVNCTTCHRGEIKPALDLPLPAKTSRT